MDLVKRKSGQPSCKPDDGYGFAIQGFASQPANSLVVQEVPQVLGEIWQIHQSTGKVSEVLDLKHIRSEEGTLVLADSQQPEQICQQGAVQQFKKGNMQCTDNGLQHEQDQVQGIRSEYFLPEVDHTKASLPKEKSEVLKQSEQPVRAKQRKHEMLSRWEHETAQIAQQLREADDQFQLVKTSENPNQNVVNTSLQNQKSYLPSKMYLVAHSQPLNIKETVINNENVECQDKLIDEFQGNQEIHLYKRDSSLERQIDLEERDLNQTEVQGQTYQWVELDSLVPQEQIASQEYKIRCELDKQEKKSASEGASLLLLLADGKRHTTEEVPNITGEAISEVKVIDESEHQQQSSTSQCMRKREHQDSSGLQCMGADELVTKEEFQTLKNAENQDTELPNVDDDREGTLIIVDGDPQIVDVENGVQDGKTSSTYSESYDNAESYDNKVSDVIEVIYQAPPEDETLDKEKQNSLPKSRSRIESQKKMEEGKQWLINNLMMISSSLSVIKLSDIESSYLSHCQQNNKEPLATPVLARLIHSLFPKAEKCRLGARGNQRIHYRSLKFKTEEGNTKQKSTDLCKDTTNKSKANQSKSQLEPQTSQQSLDKKESTDQKPRLDQSKTSNSILDATDLFDEDSQASYQSGQSDTSLAADDEENCKAASKKLSEVLKWITVQGEEYRKALLRDFAHSASCQKPTCVPVCLMFRRVRRHVVAAQHSCSVLRLYSMLLRHHVSSCTQAKCGLPACPALRATRPTKRPLEIQQHPAKRAAVYQTPGVYRPSSIILAPRSPGGSLPGSPVNSPPASPSASPGRSILSLTPGQVPVQVIMVPVMVENHGA